jgi:hypothetical protein
MLSKSAENGFGAGSRVVLDGRTRTLPQSDGRCHTGAVSLSVTGSQVICDEKRSKAPPSLLTCPGPLGPFFLQLFKHSRNPGLELGAAVGQ